ncbi:MAG: ankyrin repeat domain-containing protein [Cyanobacteria bacterium RI_101]|nr:ankyrin repeat domain-containing protein [Cyanobacteria bacterium RI_101]
MDLLGAAKRGDEQGVRAALSQGAEPNKTDRQGHTALLYAVHQGNLAMAEALLSAGAEVDLAKTPQGLTPLMLAAARGQRQIAQMLLEAGADPNRVNEDGSTALMVAAYRGDPVLTAQLLQSGADPNLVDKQGDSALGLAIRGNFPALMTQLLRAGADPHRGDCWFTAASENRGDCLQVLLDLGWDVNLADEEGETALHLACLEGRLDIVKQLLRAGTDINPQTALGDTPLALATLQGHEEIVQFLLDRGADPHLGVPGETPLTLALQIPSPLGETLTALLLKFGAVPQGGDLIGAAEAGETEKVRLLLEAGATVNAQDQTGATALMRAAFRGRREVVAQLLTVPGLDLGLKNRGGHRALDLAELAGRRDIADLLRQAVAGD